jgi:hypothetical protein
MRPQYNVKEQYVGTGLLTEYTFDFKVQNAEQLRVIVLDPSQAEYDDQLIFDDTGDHLTNFTTTLNSDGTGKISLVNALGASFILMILLADDAPTQPYRFVNNDAFTLEKIENALDWASGQIQRLAYRMGRSFRLPERFTGTFDMEIPEIVPLGIPRVNATSDAFELKTIEEMIASVSGSGLPTGGVAGDYPEKQTATEGDTDWVSGVFSGYSGQFGRFVNLTGLRNALLDIYAFVYSAPTVSFTASGSTTVREKGTVVASTTLSAVITKTATAIASVVFKQGATVLSTPTPSGASETLNYSGAITSFSDNTTFSVVVTDTISTSPAGGPTAVTSTKTFTFVYPYYYGPGAAGLTGAQVRSLLTNYVIVSTATVGPLTFAVNGSQKIYFAYPSSYGALLNILDVNGFDNIGAFTRTTVSITGLDATSQSYYVYESNSTPVAGSYDFTFKR